MKREVIEIGPIIHDLSEAQHQDRERMREMLESGATREELRPLKQAIMIRRLGQFGLRRLSKVARFSRVLVVD